jgi:competence protein ComGC
MKITKISILIILLMGSIFAQEKTFHLKSGDQVTGTVKSQTDSTYVIRNSFW